MSRNRCNKQESLDNGTSECENPNTGNTLIEKEGMTDSNSLARLGCNVSKFGHILSCVVQGHS